MTGPEIISLLPYQRPFLFVDQITEISEDGCKGTYTYRLDETFYLGHFKDNPITPGVILIETMAQIGLVCLGIYILRAQVSVNHLPQIAMTSNKVDFYLPVLPGETITVTSSKEVFRFNKLKCKIEMHNASGHLVCRGNIQGMLIPSSHES